MSNDSCTLLVGITNCILNGPDHDASTITKGISVGDYKYAIAFQERIKILDEEMNYCKNLAEMYVGDDLSLDFYGWVFLKCDHIAIDTGSAVGVKNWTVMLSRTKLRILIP